MKKAIFLFFTLINLNSSFAADVIFPKDDVLKEMKLRAISEINEIMGSGNAVDIVLNSKKVLLWANSAKALPRYDSNGDRYYEETSLPLFMASTAVSEERVRVEMERICECDLASKEVAGILIADPFTAAKMFFRRGYNGYDGSELDGKVPPIVIIYHEFGHVKDYILNDEWFLDMASMMDRQWSNKAEESAVQTQNDLSITLASKRQIYPRIRRSYGRNELYLVDDLFSF
jgi:hypothetical protein